MNRSAPPSDRILLSTWPTPLEPAPSLAGAIGLAPESLWLKRDDLTGLGAGGNKIRKLEWTVGAALVEGADTLVTTGAPQSNHARLTAAAAARAGLDAVLVLLGEPGREPDGNLLLDSLMGAHVVWTGAVPAGGDEQELLDAVAHREVDRLLAEGRRPAVIPFGGSSATGAHGYRLAAIEITSRLPHVAHVVTALGSGGTMAGLVAELGPSRVLGVHTGAVPDPADRVATLLAEMGHRLSATDLRVRHDQVGDGYASLTPAVEQAMQLAGRRHGLVLDPTYSGRALAGLMAEVADGAIAPGDTVVFLASGGLPGLFAHPEASRLTNQHRN